MPMCLIDEQYLKTPFYGSRRMERLLESSGTRGQSQADSEADASHGDGGGLSEKAHNPPLRRQPGLPLSAQRGHFGTPQSDLEHRHHLHLHVKGIHEPRGPHAVVFPIRT